VERLGYWIDEGYLGCYSRWGLCGVGEVLRSLGVGVGGVESWARRYELSDWLGDVRVVVTDRRIPIRGDNQVVVGYRAEVVSVTDYYSFGAEISMRSYEAQPWYRYGYQAQEKDHEIYGKGAMYHYNYRQHDARLGRFWSVDPLARKYPWNSPYAFGGNRVVDAVELEGLEYVEVRHYHDGRTEKVLYYTMTKEEVKRLGGTPRRLFNAAPHGREGKGVLHIYYDEQGRVKERYREMWRSFFLLPVNYGLYSGDGCVTESAKEEVKKYDYSYQPIDAADWIAREHDRDYEKVPQLKRLNFLENTQTLGADIKMVERVDKALISILTFRSFEIEGSDTKPVYTGFNFETLYALFAQRIFISSLATYKAWKIEFHSRLKEKHLRGEYINPQLREFAEGEPWDSNFGILGKYFIPKHPLRGFLLWITYKRAKKDE